MLNTSSAVFLFSNDTNSEKFANNNEIFTESDEHDIRRSSSQKLRNESRNEGIRRKKYEEFKRKSQQAVRNTIEASKTESCDVKLSFYQLPDPVVLVSNSLKNFKGEMCGSYYKVLDIDKSTINDQMDENTRKRLLKKAYRKLSLTVHPDKHGGSSEAHMAFEKIQDAYDCLSDDICRETYDSKLQSIEQSILQHRLKVREIVVRAIKRTIKVVHYHTSMTAFFIRHVGNQIASFFDRWQVEQNNAIAIFKWYNIMGMEKQVSQYLSTYVLYRFPCSTTASCCLWESSFSGR